MMLTLGVCVPLKFMTSLEGSVWGAVLAGLNNSLILQYLPLFAIGILLNEIKNKTGKLWLNIIGIAAATIVFHAIDQRDHNPAVTLLMITVLGFSAFGKFPPLRFRPLVFVSAISYSLYLMHNNLGCTLIYHLNQNGISPWASMLLATAGTIVISTIATFWIERPISNGLRKIWIRVQKTRPLMALESRLQSRVTALG
jgi:peptidoglycan/LPS O-acetylase OafA/YrhL